MRLLASVGGCDGARVRGAFVLGAFVLGAFVLTATTSHSLPRRSVAEAGGTVEEVQAGQSAEGAKAGHTLPQGPGRDVVAKRCMACHEADLIVAQRLTRPAWGRSVDKMVRWGATVEADERDRMLDYLSAHFAPQPAASHIVATAQHEGIYKRACLTCHDADIVEAQRLTRAGWVRTVDKMIRWGAVVPDADKEGLIDYLAARYPQR